MIYLFLYLHKKTFFKHQIHFGYCVGRQVCKQEAQLSNKDMMEAWMRVETQSDLGNILEVKITGLDAECEEKQTKQQTT